MGLPIRGTVKEQKCFNNSWGRGRNKKPKVNNLLNYESRSSMGKRDRGRGGFRSEGVASAGKVRKAAIITGG